MSKFWVFFLLIFCSSIFFYSMSTFLMYYPPILNIRLSFNLIWRLLTQDFDFFFLKISNIDPKILSLFFITFGLLSQIFTLLGKLFLKVLTSLFWIFSSKFLLFNLIILFFISNFDSIRTPKKFSTKPSFQFCSFTSSGFSVFTQSIVQQDRVRRDIR